MKRNFHLNLQSPDGWLIPFEEIMFLSSLKINQLNEILEEVYGVEILLTPVKNEKLVNAAIKIEARNGQYGAISNANHWETALIKAYDSILHQGRANYSFPIRENTN